MLGEEAETFMVAYGVKPGGNWEGKKILELVRTQEEREALADARRKLFQVRERRVHPGRDEKVLTSWNGPMMVAFAEAARTLDRDDGSRALAASYRRVAERNAHFLLRELRQENGVCFVPGKPVLSRSKERAKPSSTGTWRTIELQDNATPSGNAMAIATWSSTDG